MEGHAGAARLNPRRLHVRGTFNPLDFQRFSLQSGPVGGENLARPT
jgi:hypothetical protein